MKIILLQPPVRDFYDTDIRLQPLGLCMLKAAVMRYLPDIEVIVKDYHQGYGRKTIPYPNELSYLKGYYQHHDAGPFSMFHHYYHFGLDFDEIGRDVAGEKPDLVGISSLFSPYHGEALGCAKAIKGLIDAPIIMGGPHVSAMPLFMLQDPNVDYIIRGEGERPLVEFLSAFQSGRHMKDVPNLGFKQGSKPILNPMGEPYELGDLPWPDLSDLAPDRYMLHGKPLCFITTSRGCPHRCAFCSVHLTFGDHFRTRSVEDIIAEIKKRYDDGYRVFDFEDDNLSFKREDFKDLLNRLISGLPEDDISLVAMNGISYMSLDPEILELMKRAGFTGLNLSLVSANDATLSRARRPHTLKKYLEIIDCAHALGFEIVSYQILGLPYETLDDMTETMILLSRLPVLIGVSLFYMTPGSAIAMDYHEMTGDDIVRARSTAMAIETDQFDRDDLYTLFITARIINFIKGLGSGRKENMNFTEAIEAARGSGKRGVTGVDLLNILFKEKRLYAATGNGMKELSHFKGELFLRIWEKVSSILSQTGTWIDVSGPLSP